MQVLHLLFGLIGLANLGFAAPAPSDSAPFDVVVAANTADELGLLYACQRPKPERSGVCGSVTAFNQCQDFSDLLAGQVRYLNQFKGVMCYYYSQKGCSPKHRSLEIDSSQWRYSANIAENVGSKILSVLCFVPRVVPVPHEHGPRSDTPLTVNEEPDQVDLAGISALSTPGDIIVCQNTLGNGSCETVHAQNQCVSLGNELSHKVRTIYQASGSVCRYFESDCSARHPVVSVNSSQKPSFVQLDEQIGHKLGLALCKNNWPPLAALEPGSTAVQTPSSDITIWASDNPKLVRSEAYTQPLYVCDHESFAGRFLGPGCTNNPFTAPTFTRSLRIQVTYVYISVDLPTRDLLTLYFLLRYQCAFYHELDCQAKNSAPNYEQADGQEQDNVHSALPNPVNELLSHLIPPQRAIGAYDFRSQRSRSRR